MYIPQDRNVIYHYIISIAVYINLILPTSIFFGRYTNNYEDVAGQNWFGAQPEVFSVSFAHFRSWQGGSTYTGNLYFSPPARWGLLDFMSVACSSPPPVLLLNRDPRRTVFSVGPQPRPSTPSVPCRTSTTTIHAQCSLPDLNHDHPRPVWTSTTTIHAQCSLPDLNREYPRQVFPTEPHVGRYGTKNVQKKVRKNVRKNVRRYARRYAR